jgi:hypothetical protein
VLSSLAPVPQVVEPPKKAISRPGCAVADCQVVRSPSASMLMVSP